MSSVVRAAVVWFALVLAIGCPAEENAAGTGGTAGQPIAGATAGMAAGAAGMLATTGGAGGLAGVMAMTGGVGGMGTGGVAGVPVAGMVAPMLDSGVPMADAMVAPLPGHADCAPGYDCRNPTGQYICVDAMTSMPLACTMGGTECTAIPGSNCIAGPAGLQCLKACGEATAAGCPMGTACMNPFGVGAFCALEGGALPPACTVGGTECEPYGLSCLAVMGITGCWMNCTL